MRMPPPPFFPHYCCWFFCGKPWIIPFSFWKLPVSCVCTELSAPTFCFLLAKPDAFGSLDHYLRSIFLAPWLFVFLLSGLSIVLCRRVQYSRCRCITAIETILLASYIRSAILPEILPKYVKSHPLPCCEFCTRLVEFRTLFTVPPNTLSLCIMRVFYL